MEKDPDKEEFDGYLKPFQRRNWKMALGDLKLINILNDLTTSAQHWGTGHTPATAEQFSRHIVFSYMELTALSKLDFTLCFPYVKYQHNSSHHRTLHSLSEIIFQNSEVLTTDVVNVYQPILRNATNSERFVKLKVMHLNAILTTPNLTNHTSEGYISTVKSLHGGLQALLAQIQYEKEEDLAVQGILSGNFDDELFGPDGYDESHVDFFADGFDMPNLETERVDDTQVMLTDQEIQRENQLAAHFQLSDSMRKMAQDKLKKRKAQEINIAKEKAKEARGMAKIYEIIQTEAETYRRMTVEKVLQNNPNNPNPYPNGKTLAQKRRADVKARKAGRSTSLSSSSSSSAVPSPEPLRARLIPGDCIIVHPNPTSTGSQTKPYTTTFVPSGTCKNTQTMEEITPVGNLRKTRSEFDGPMVGGKCCPLPHPNTKVSHSECEDVEPLTIKFLVDRYNRRIDRNNDEMRKKATIIQQGSYVPCETMDQPLIQVNKNYSNGVIKFKKQEIAMVRKSGETLLCRPHTDEFGETVLEQIEPDDSVPRNSPSQVFNLQGFQLEEAIPLNACYPTNQPSHLQYQTNDEAFNTNLYQQDLIQQVADDEEIVENETNFNLDDEMHIFHDHNYFEALNPNFEFQEAVLSCEEIQDTGGIRFRPPRPDDYVFSADEIENQLVPTCSVTKSEYAKVEAEYPDLFGPDVEIEDDLKFIMAAFMFKRLKNQHADQGTRFNFKVSENTYPITIDNVKTKRVVELFFEMNYDTMSWTRVHRTKLYRQEGVQTTIESLDVERDDKENEMYLTQF